MSWEFFRSRTVRSKTERRCDECRGPIPAGQPHHYGAGKTEGEFIDQRLCTVCNLIISEGFHADLWDDEGFPLGEVRAQMRDDHDIDDPEAWAKRHRAARLAAKNVKAESLDRDTFIALMADRFRSQVRRPGPLGWLRIRYSRAWAMGHAQVAYDAYIEGEAIGDAPLPFGHPDYAWDREGADAIVDTELSYWGEG